MSAFPGVCSWCGKPTLAGVEGIFTCELGLEGNPVLGWHQDCTSLDPVVVKFCREDIDKQDAWRCLAIVLGRGSAKVLGSLGYEDGEHTYGRWSPTP